METKTVYRVEFKNNLTRGSEWHFDGVTEDDYTGRAVRGSLSREFPSVEEAVAYRDLSSRNDPHLTHTVSVRLNLVKP